MPLRLWFFLQYERKSSIGLVVPVSSCGLLQAVGQTRLRGLGQTKLRGQPAVPKGIERVLRAGSELPFPSGPLQNGGRGQDGAKGAVYTW